MVAEGFAGLVPDSITSEAANFSAYKIVSIRVAMRANLRRLSNLQSTIDMVAKRLSSWKCKDISLGGRL
ncbi:hypothetical protein Lalb_Chr18g0047941 [Lupinus albus]|uniref:Uncharacterized protein n=1 Tax=Lupinus albus TaxID=3870 RepID=A0A6A4NXK8_LUPAL|nr:hypothetical protein Lalb_Chr18g0047941 [Lupinus albus]